MEEKYIKKINLFFESSIELVGSFHDVFNKEIDEIKNKRTILTKYKSDSYLVLIYLISGLS